MKKIAFTAILILILSLSLFALAEDEDIIAENIFYQEGESLRNMDQMHGIDREDISAGEIHDAEEVLVVENTTEEEGTYSIEVKSADSLETRGSLITLRGNVVLSFTYRGESTELICDEVVIDTSASLIIALGNVSFRTDRESSMEEIFADIVTFYWEKGNIVVENASTMNERKNSEDETINVYSVGERLTYFESGAAIYDDGYIASSDENPLSSISASRITMLPGSDMLIENAVLKVGRVPLFYFPLFFFPGTQITGNPAFGFTSSKGAFLNTTFEVFGRSELIDQTSSSSSFLSIFASNDANSDDVPRGAYYTSTSELTALESWARSSSSYLTVMADAYSDLGVHFGLDSRINLFDKALALDTFSGVALTVPGLNSSTLRYYSQSSLSYTYSGLTIFLSYPVYSDSNVLVDLGNRITSFSIEPLFYISPSFPSTYSSSITSFTRYAEIKYTLPSALRTDFLSSFSISRLRAESSYSWSSSSREYQINYIDLPELTMTASGSIFNFEYTDTGVEPDELDAAELFLLSDPLLYDMFHEDLISEGHTSSSYSIGMGYTLTERLENNIDYYNGERDASSFSSVTSLKITTELDLGNYFVLRSILTPSYSYDRDEDESDDTLTYEHEFSLTNTIEAEIPMLGLKYRLTNTAYEYNRVFSSDTLTENKSIWDFDSDHVSTHELSLSKTINTAAGSFTPSLSYTLYPLTGSLTPALSYRYGNFAAAFSYRFLNEEEGSVNFSSDLISLSLAYNGTYLVASSSITYQSSDYVSSDFFVPMEISSQISLRSADRRFSIAEQLEWSGYDSSENMNNYVSSLRTVLTLPYFTGYIDFSGPFDSLELDTLYARVSAQNIQLRAWRNRIYLSLGLSSTLTLDVQNMASSSFSITPSIIFSIAEFMDFRLSFTSSNNNFGAYMDGDSFSFPLLCPSLT